MRLACLYALLDRSYVVGRLHLQAALAVWRYCFESASHIFGATLGDPIADEILRALKASPVGLTRSELIHGVFAGNKTAPQIARALALLAESHLARSEEDRSNGGRPAERWFACEGDDFNDKYDQSPVVTPGNVVNVVNVVAPASDSAVADDDI